MAIAKVNGLAKADLSKINGLAKADINKISGLTASFEQYAAVVNTSLGTSGDTYRPVMAYDTHNDKLVVFYQSATSSTNVGKFRVGTVGADGAVTWGSIATWDAGQTSSGDNPRGIKPLFACFNSSINKVVVGYNSAVASGNQTEYKAYSRYGAISGSGGSATITMEPTSSSSGNSAGYWSGEGVERGQAVYHTKADKVIVHYEQPAWDDHYSSTEPVCQVRHIRIYGDDAAVNDTDMTGIVGAYSGGSVDTDSNPWDSGAGSANLQAWVGITYCASIERTIYATSDDGSLTLRCARTGGGSTITEDLDNSETQIDVADGTQFQDGDLLVMRGTGSHEYMEVISVAGNTITVTERGLGSWSAYTHSNGDYINNYTHNLGADCVEGFSDADDIQVAWDEDNNKGVCIWTGNSDGHLRYHTFTVNTSTNAITFADESATGDGSEGTFESTAACDSVNICYDESANHFVIVYRMNNKLYFRTAKFDGTTPNLLWGSSSGFAATNDDADDRVLIYPPASGTGSTDIVRSTQLTFSPANVQMQKYPDATPGVLVCFWKTDSADSNPEGYVTRLAALGTHYEQTAG